MAGAQPIVVDPPAEDGGRRVRIDGHSVGTAYTLLDLVEFLRRAGLENADDDRVRESGMIEWRGGGPGGWEV